MKSSIPYSLFPIPYSLLGRSWYFLKRRWRLVLLSLLTLLLTLIAVPSSAQTPPVQTTDKAAVVLDGRFLFEVGSLSNNYTAVKRADIINQALAEEVRSPQPGEIEVFPKNELAIVRSQRSQRELLTVTEKDLVEGSNPLEQANIWQGILEDALRQGHLERTPIYYRQALVFGVGVLLGAIAMHLGLGVLGKKLSRHLSLWLGQPTSPLHRWEQPAQLFLQLGLLGVKVGLWTAIFLYVTDLFPQVRTWRYELFTFLVKLFNFLNSPVINLGNNYYSALQLILLLGFTVGLWFAVSSLTQLFKSYVLGRTGAEPRVQEIIAVLMQYILTFLGLIALLQIWGLDVGSLTLLASVLGVGIGFGVQNITNNFISGLIITFERPIQVGDFVKVNELMGTVERIGARSTEIRTLDQVTIIVPNSRFLESEVINWSHGNPVSRLQIPVGVAYGSNVEKVQVALLEAAKGHPEVLLQPPPQVWFQSFGESAINFNLLVWMGDPKKQFKVKSDLNYRIEASLHRYGIQVPFPQRDLHLRSPKLEELLAALLYKSPPTPAQNPSDFTDRDQPKMKGNHDGASHLQDTTVSTEPQSELSLTTVISGTEITEAEMEALVRAMRETGGVEIKDRSYHLNIYPSCFIGAEAVEWLVQRYNCSRLEAINLGQILLDRGIIRPVLDEHFFQDDYSFYRFPIDEG
ncbi:MAG TPA: mechanosensitive ion channel protein MscS [Cyanobacteria bacterium UBA8803]|nr:mechanosensitive ion channel protein MscS [Cyanobacteria bacterium UBA9273]HBL60373.1 mechanosensitive ion channel protein MscS [Cyanobacteria bacterium UBA8803]